jgi:hypothetical protein
LIDPVSRACVCIVGREVHDETDKTRNDAYEPRNNGSPVDTVPKPVDTVSLIEIGNLPLAATDDPVIGIND